MRNSLKAHLQCNNSNDPNVTFGDTVANPPQTENVECQLNAKHVFHSANGRERKGVLNHS